MRAKHNGKKWIVTFLDDAEQLQKTEHTSLQLALAMAFINKTMPL